ncbi:MAG: chromate efflux transporter [Phycisphaeraceae bacterium]|nr:chromate efflux transporter [Phycisphaeraceae bacterium]
MSLPHSQPLPAARGTRAVPLREAVRVWAVIGLQSFGGPAGQIALMHRILVQEKKWVGEARFLHALNYCMLLPGPEATQLATYIGWLMHRTAGGLIAGCLFILPGFLSILALSLLYAGFRDMTLIDGLFFGLKPALLAVVVQAVIKIGGRALRGKAMHAVAAAAFVAIFVFDVPFPLIVLVAAIAGLVLRALGFARPALPAAPGGDEEDDGSILGNQLAEHTRPSVARAVRTSLIWLCVWFVPVGVLAYALGPGNVFVKQATFFSTAAVVTFGGAYAVLAFIAQQAVEVYGWLRPGEMLDGLGMAETTPGPLIQVVQFVGFMGAYREPGPMNPYAAGALASVLVTWVTFVPCFLWIFVGAPFIESLRRSERLAAALSAVTAAAVGVILNLAIWFAAHTLFGTVGTVRALGGKVIVPEPASINPGAAAIAMVAGVLLFGFKRGMLTTLLVCGALGVVWKGAAAYVL